MRRKGVVLYLPGSITESMLGTLNALGTKDIRLELQSVDDAGVVNLLTSRGKNVTAMVPLTIVPGAGPAQWQAPTNSVVFGQYVEDYVQQFELLAASMQGVQVFEFLNEPASLGSKFRLSAQSYAKLYYAVHVAGRASVPHAQLITGGVFAWDPDRYGGDTYANSAAEYIRQVTWIEEIMQHPLTLDGVGIHFYLDPAKPVNIQTLHDYMGYYASITDRPIYITEMGWESGVVGTALQAANLATMYHELAAYPQVVVAHWFSLFDFVSQGRLRTWGLEAPTALEGKPSFFAYKEVI